jgi:hypothetical protein
VFGIHLKNSEFCNVVTEKRKNYEHCGSADIKFIKTFCSTAHNSDKYVSKLIISHHIRTQSNLTIFVNLEVKDIKRKLIFLHRNKNYFIEHEIHLH